MFAILTKEIRSFFASAIGFLVIAVFLLSNGLFLWIFKGDLNILDNGFADLSAFFAFAPWIFTFLIPAITMRSVSEEKSQGTLELLLTKPISKLAIVLGKYFAAILLILVSLLPTLIYVYTVYILGNPIGNLDTGSTIGSYIGLLFLAFSYAAIGVFGSTITNNPLIAFIVSVFLCLLFYVGIPSFADLFSSNFIDQLGIASHYNAISRGVIDTQDLFYFSILSLFFLIVTVRFIGSTPLHKKEYRILGMLAFIGIVIPLILQALNIQARFDLTKDKRYTISATTLQIIKPINSPVVIDVFLEGTSFPSEFRRLQTETLQLLNQFKRENNAISYTLINPLEDVENSKKNISALTKRGLKPMQLSVKENGKTSQEVIFPWALASHNNQTVKIPLVLSKIGATQQELVTNSIAQLEYAFANALQKLTQPKRKKIAVLKGNKQLEDGYLFDFISTLKESYFIAPFTLDSVATNAENTLKKLNEYHLIINAKPLEAFTEKEKYVLDQYTMQGGKSVWLIDKVAIDKDSLYNDNGKGFAVTRNLELTDFFFKYGIRINSSLVNDLYSAPITIASGEGNKTQFNQFPWFYDPLVTSTLQHPITKAINVVKFNFVNPIDTLKNAVKKTILLESSTLSKLDGVPREINLQMATQTPNPQLYTKGKQPLAILLEGNFPSVYTNRIKPFTYQNDTTKSVATKMVVIADGDLIKNEITKNGPLELGFDRTTLQTYGNKDFLLNTVNYLLDDTGLINIRGKEIVVAFLDFQKVANQKTKWQIINIAVPILFLALFGGLFYFLQKKKYSKK